MSRIGKKIILIPKDTKIEISQTTVTVEGPKGRLKYDIPFGIKVESKNDQIMVSRYSDSKKDKSLHGLTRSLIFNMIKGVTDGFTKELEIVGVGFRAQTQGSILSLQLGFTNPVNFQIPEGINITTPKPTHIVIKGADKMKVGEVTAKIRAIYKPEPYKGKGIRYIGEHIRRKAGKSVA